MNVASLDLCKELFELSGWRGEKEPVWIDLDGRFYLSKYSGLNGGVETPAYNLGYLLRKLQDDDLTIVLRWNRDMGSRIAMKAWDKKYCIGTFDMPQGEYPIADTPEDAAAMLAVHLFKRGVLQREPES